MAILERHPTTAGRCRIFPFEIGSAAAQLARSETCWQAVAEGQAPPSLRWYSFYTTGLLLGVSQPWSTIDPAACRAAAAEVAKRSSGGTAVLVDQSTLALDVALPAGHPLASSDVVEAYRWLGETYLDALKTLAPKQAHRLTLVSVEDARRDRQEQRAAAQGTPACLRALACYGTLSPYEVAWRRPGAKNELAKLVGLSQLRKRGVVFYQAGLFARPFGATLARLLAVSGDGRRGLAEELDRRTATFADLDLTTAAFEDVVAAVTSAISRLLCA